MATQTPVSSEIVQIPTSSRPLIGGSRFDWLFALTTSWYVGGAYLDAWAHNNIPQLETFWTPWHAVLYSGVVATLCVLSATILLNRRRGAPDWLAAIPAGYKLAVVGLCGMLLGGAGDALWHTFFGIEQNLDGTLSPTHLFLMIASSLIMTAPLRALYHRKTEPTTFSDHLLLAYALTLFYAIVMVIAQVFHPFLNSNFPLTASNSNTQGNEQLLAILGFIVQMGFFTGCALYMIRRWTLRFGFFTFVLTIVSIGLAQMQNFQLGIPISLVSGLVIDAAYLWLKPGKNSPLALRLFAAIASAVLPAFYLLGLSLVYGPLAWTIHMLIGSVVVCGIFGWLLSYLVIPSQLE